MNHILVYIGLNVISVMFFIRKNIQIKKEICQYIELEYPEHWQKFMLNGKRLGKQEKWSTLFAIESATSGEVFKFQNPHLLQLQTRQSKNISLMALSPIILAIAITLLESLLG